MSHKSNKKIIRITHQSLNTDKAYVFDLVVKLSYSFEKNKPALEIFVNDEEAQKEEWDVYGAKPGAESDRAARVKFSALNEIKKFQLGDSRFRIQFIKMGEKEVNYCRGRKKMEPEYEFVIEENLVTK